MKGFQKWVEILILAGQMLLGLVIVVNAIFSRGNSPINDYIFLAIIIFLVSMKVIKWKYFKIAFMIFLLLGTCNLLNTSVFSYNGGGTLSYGKAQALNVSFNIFYFFPLVIFISFNHQIITRRLEKEAKEYDDQKEKPSDHYLTKYYEDLKDKENIYLENIISTKERWQKEYVLAAKQILNERNSQ